MRVVTTDLYEASFLDCAGVELADMWVDRGRARAAVVFAFDGEDSLLALQRSYHTGDATANVAAYRRSLSRLRQLLHQRLKTPDPEPTRQRTHHHVQKVSTPRP